MLERTRVPDPRSSVDLVDGLGLLALSRAIEGRTEEATALARQARSAAQSFGTDAVSAVLPDVVLGWTAPERPRRPGSLDGRDALAAVVVAFVRAGLHGARGDVAGASDAVQHLRMPVRLAATSSTAESSALVDPLTPKEREVLTLLSDLLTTEEIARSMFVSVNTVKTHIRGILRKLEVRRRHEAVRRARQLQLIA